MGTNIKQEEKYESFAFPSRPLLEQKGCTREDIVAVSLTLLCLLLFFPSLTKQVRRKNQRNIYQNETRLERLVQ
jgi:hypothetical protein